MRTLVTTPGIVLLAATLSCVQATAADRFDLIYSDHIVQNCGASNGTHACGFSLCCDSFGIIINTGSSNITAEDLMAATFTAAASAPGFHLVPYVAQDLWRYYCPILPGEAVGSVDAYNAALPSLILPTEVFHNEPGMLILGLYLGHFEEQVSQGPITFDVTMSMSGLQVRFPITYKALTAATPGLSRPTAARVSSSSVTPAPPATWGRLKALYR